MLLITLLLSPAALVYCHVFILNSNECSTRDLKLFHNEYCQDIEENNAIKVFLPNEDSDYICVEITIRIVNLVNNEQKIFNCSNLDSKTRQCLTDIVQTYSACFVTEEENEPEPSDTEDCNEEEKVPAKENNTELSTPEDWDQIQIEADTRTLRTENETDLAMDDYDETQLKHRSNLTEIDFLTDIKIRQLMKNASLEDLYYKKQLMQAFKNMHEFMFCVYPYIMATEFVIGIFGNGLLLAIFIRYKSMRTKNNATLINLSITDIFSLVFNLPLAYLAIKYDWIGAVIFYDVLVFFRFLAIFMSTYCIVVISFERLRAISNFNTQNSQTYKFTVVLKTIIVWVCGIIYSIPCTISRGTTYAADFDAYFNLISLRILPVILIVTFSILASKRLRKSVEMFPGERQRHEERLNNRILASKALIGLVVLLLISYLPVNIVTIYEINEYMNVGEAGPENKIARVYFMFISHAMFCLNSTFNPLVLYFLSSKFRICFKSILTCKAEIQY